MLFGDVSCPVETPINALPKPNPVAAGSSGELVITITWLATNKYLLLQMQLRLCHRCICCNNTCFQRNVGKVPNFLVKAEYCKTNKAIVIDLRRPIRQNRPRSIGGVHGFVKRGWAARPKLSLTAIQSLKSHAYITTPSTWTSWCTPKQSYRSRRI